MGVFDEAILPGLVGVGSALVPRAGAAAAMGLGAVADYQQHQKDKLQKQRFSDMISQAPFFEPGERELASNMMLAGQQDLAQQMFTSALARSQKRAAQEAEMAGLPAQLDQIAAMGPKMVPGMSYSRPAPGGGSISFNPPEPPQPKTPPQPRWNQRTEEVGKDVFDIVEEQQADGSFKVISRNRIGPAPDRTKSGDKSGAYTASQLRARALGGKTENEGVNAMSPEDAFTRLSETDQKHVTKKLKEKAAKTVPTQTGGKTPQPGGQAPQMSDAAARLAARFGIGK